MTRKRKIVFGCLLPPLLILMVLVIIGLINFFEGPRRSLGDRTIAILRGATRVETFRLNDTGEGDWLGSTQIKQFPIVGQGKTLDRTFAEKLARASLDARTYVGPNDTTCLFNPGVAFRAWRGQECVEVILCFHCGQMLITAKDAQGRKIHTTYTEFLLMRAEFIVLAQEAFPNDKEIHSLT